MKFLTRVSQRIQTYASKRTIIPIILFLALVLMTMQVGTQGLKRIDSDYSMLDMRKLGYTSTVVYDLLSRLGFAGRLIYTQQLGIDFLFAIFYACFQSLMLSNLSKRAGLPTVWGLVNLLPFVRTTLDITENILLMVIIRHSATQMPVLVGVSSAITVTKWLVYFVILASLFSLGALTTSKMISAKKLSPKVSKG